MPGCAPGKRCAEARRIWQLNQLMKPAGKTAAGEAGHLRTRAGPGSSKFAGNFWDASRDGRGPDFGQLPAPIVGRTTHSGRDAAGRGGTGARPVTQGRVAATTHGG